MKKLGKILLITLGVIVVLLVAAISLTVGWRPFIGPKARPLTDRKFESTPERVARGRYMASMANCEMCHTQRDWTTHAAPMLPGTEMAGQPMPLEGLPGRLIVSNVTPDKETGAGNWSDDQLARAIREGIGHDGRTLFPLMPYAEYREMSDEDVASVVAYLRSLPPVRNPLPKTEIIFPVKYLIRMAPQPVTEAVHGPNMNIQIERGKYIATIGCDCHSLGPRGPVPGLEFAGGFHLKGPWGEVSAANITPDASGISYYDEATFITTMRTGYVGARKLSNIMPFAEFKNLTDDDLKAVFAYLRTVKPVKHRVDNTLPPTYCKVCKQSHGGGDQN